MSAARVSLVDDDRTFRQVLARELVTAGCEVDTFADGSDPEAILAREPDAILLDLRLPGASGIEVLEELLALDPAAQVVLLTGHGAVPEAVEAMRLGACDFLTKPAPLAQIERALQQARSRRAMLLENRRLRRAATSSPPSRLLGESPAIEHLRSQIARVAPSDVAVLIEGEHGTGKELVARQLHRASERADQPLVVVNCAAIPVALLESELFGHRRGAFTGADATKVGLFEAADRGTLFLDEIGEMPLASQSSLLRALQFGEIRPVGGESTLRVDVRIVAATNRHLLDRVAEGEFREDLYYRLATVRLTVPPLRERSSDIPILAQPLLARARQQKARDIRWSDSALLELQRHPWPGNVRELENAVTRLCLLADGPELSADDIKRHLGSGASEGSLRPGELPTLCLADLEQLAIRAALTQLDGNKHAAARALGIAVKTLYNKLERYGLKDSWTRATREHPAGGERPRRER